MKTSDSCVPEIDRRIGITRYATDFDGIGGHIRSRYRDFLVEEILDSHTAAGITETPTTTNRHPIYRMIKEGIDTPHALRQIRRSLGWRVTYLGLKDAQARTTQYITSRHPMRDAPSNLRVSSKISLELCGYSDGPLMRKSLAMNRFTIRVADVEAGVEALEDAASRLKRAVDEMRVPNFFGYQRFGAKRPVNHVVGRELLKGGLEEAVKTFLVVSSGGEGVETRPLREELDDPAMYPSLLKRLDRSLDIEMDVLKVLIDHPGDWVKALRVVPLTVRRLFINSYQSYLFNRVMSRALDEGADLIEGDRGDIYGRVDTRDGSVTEIRRGQVDGGGGSNERILPLVQLVGYAYRAGGGRFDRLTQELLDEEEVSPRMFYLKSMPELSMEGGFRIPSLLVKSFDIRIEPSDAGVCLLRFGLSKGSYATVLLRELMKPSDPVAAGF